MRELRRRIRGVTSIQKITRAMEMIASTRLRKMQSRAEGARPYADALKQFSALLAARGAELSVEIAQKRETVKRIGILVIGSDRGLCGSYNPNVYRKVAALIEEKKGVEVDLYLLGKKPRQHYARRLPIKTAYPDAVEKLEYRRARAIASELTERFLLGSDAKSGEGDAGGVDEVWIVYTRFLSAGRQVPAADRLLPVTIEEATAAAGGSAAPDAKAGGATAKRDAAAELVLLEPSLEQLFRLLMPKSLAVRVYAAMLDAMASEQAARRAAMKAATDAAGDMIQALSRKYNRARQEAITKELLDIVGGAEALA
jgi:F-type H+-transporting ATPase subunit gamma